jgi:prephenate dehydrogenase
VIDNLTETILFDRVAILGLGLIGGSLAKAMKAAKLVNHIVAFDRDVEQIKLGLDSGAIDEGCRSCLEAVKGANLIVVAVPVMAVTSVMEEIKDAINEDVIVTDVGSVKGYVIDAVAEVFGEVPANFIAGHPIAGSEKHGVAASVASLFRNHQVILTPLKTSSSIAVAKIEALWQRTGATVVKMDPAHHDQVLAQTSHLPHLLAYGLIDTLSAQGDSFEIFEYAAGGLRDFSRIAASDPIMWRDIFRSNSEAVLSILTQYQRELSDLHGLIENEDFDQLSEVFARSKRARDHFSEVLARRAAKS